MTTPRDINDTLYKAARDMTWRDLAAIHIHAAFISAGHSSTHATEWTMNHVNALAMELERTAVTDE